MADYYLTYKCIFQSKQVENMEIELWKKDTPATSVIELRATGFDHRYTGDKGDKTSDTIITSEAILSIFITKANVDAGVDYRDFIVQLEDEWIMVAYSDGQKVFVGYLVPGEGEVDFLDHGYEVNISATDGLALLRQQPLSETSPGAWAGVHTLFAFIKECLSKTNLNLPIRINANIYESSMLTREADASKDFFQQCGVHYRSLLKTPISFDSCYDVLTRFFHQHFSLYQWNGMWVINRNAEMQESIGPTNWYTLYNPETSTFSGVKEAHTNAIVARSEKLHPINVNQRIASRFAIKSAKHIFPYDIQPEIPANNQFERGAFQGDGPDFKAWAIDEWVYINITGPSAISALPGVLGAATEAHYRKSTYDTYGIETIREVALDMNSSAGARWLQSSPVPVNKGDKIAVRFDFKTALPDDEIQMGVMVVYIQPVGGPRYSLRWNPGLSQGQWIQQPGTGADLAEIRGSWGQDEFTNEYKNFSVESAPLPIDGDMYFVLIHPAGRNNQFVYFTGFEVEYIPYTAGGYKKVLGDYWLTAQNQPFKDVVEEQVGLSDSLKKVIKGSLIRADGVTLTTKTWKRLGYDEEKHYKELLNLGVYNHKYRRMFRISGTFGGTKFSPVSDPTIFEPLSFHRHFTFPDAPELAGLYFMLVPPLAINYKDGQFDGVFVECLNANNGSTQEPTIDMVRGGIVSTVNSTTLDEWDAAGGAPPVVMIHHPPAAGIWPLNDTWVVISVNPIFTVNMIADANGAGNSPSVTLAGETGTSAAPRLFFFEIGPDIKVGNRFIVDIYGVQRVYEVPSVMRYDDGNQLGDTHQFNYQF